MLIDIEGIDGAGKGTQARRLCDRLTESGIATRDDVARMRDLGVHAFLVGEALMRERDPGAALRELFA